MKRVSRRTKMFVERISTVCEEVREEVRDDAVEVVPVRCSIR